MGETGCGKTCLIRYMCGLQSGPEGPKNMLLMKVEMYSLLFVCWGRGEGSGRFLIFFFSSYPFLFRLSRERWHIFGRLFCPPKRWHMRAWAAKGFLWTDVIPFVLLSTTEMKQWSYSLSDSWTSSRASVSRNLARVLIRFRPWMLRPRPKRSHINIFEWESVVLLCRETFSTAMEKNCAFGAQ